MAFSIFLAGGTDFDGTAGMGLVAFSTAKVRPGRILIYTIGFYTGGNLSTMTASMSPPDQPDDKIQLAFLGPPEADSIYLFRGAFVVPKLLDGRNFDLRIETTGKTQDGTMVVDADYNAF